jgi:serine/threonine protein kinase
MIDRYSLLGGGTYGKVYRGYDVKNSRHIAVKHINRQSLSSMNGIEQREIEIMKRLSHQNIMAYYGCHNGTDGLYLFL